MLMPILIGVAVVVAAFVALVALQPAAFRVSRSAAMAAPAAAAFEQVNDLRLMNEWSPWLEPDPQAKIAYAGPSAGPGASFTWDGNSEVGVGRLTIVDSRPNDLV